MPRSPPGPNKGTVAATNTMSLFVGSMTMRWMCFDSPSPICAQVLPPSVDFQTPLPQLVDCRLLLSPPPAHTRFGSCCDTVTSPNDIRPWSCSIGSQVVPPDVVFQTPPCAVATYQMAGFFS